MILCRQKMILMFKKSEPIFEQTTKQNYWVCKSKIHKQPTTLKLFKKKREEKRRKEKFVLSRLSQRNSTILFPVPVPVPVPVPEDSFLFPNPPFFSFRWWSLFLFSKEVNSFFDVRQCSRPCSTTERGNKRDS